MGRLAAGLSGESLLWYAGGKLHTGRRNALLLTERTREMR